MGFGETGKRKQGAHSGERMERMGERDGDRTDGGGRHLDFQIYFMFLHDLNCEVNPCFLQLKVHMGGGKWAGFDGVCPPRPASTEEER